jgi:O-antigen/teichoic acid export membrane protein
VKSPESLHEESGATAAARLPARVLTIAAGEGVSRGANLLLVVYLARVFGVRAAGAYALAQALSLYLMQGTDFGLRHTGARLVVQNPGSTAHVVRFIQRRRILLATIMSAFGFLYGRWGPVPQDTRSLVSLYSLAVFGYGLSVDWLAWGLRRFSLMSAWRACVSLLGLGITLVLVMQLHSGLLAVPFAVGLAYFASDAALWFFWARRFAAAGSSEKSGAGISSMPGFQATGLLGIALLVQQAFSSVDTMMLGSLTDSVQTGLYSAAYRLLLLILAVYCLGIQAIYPQLAAIPFSQRRLHALWRVVIPAAALGTAAAVVMEFVRVPLIDLIYGHAFAPSAALAAPLLPAIPLDFVATILLNVLVAWDHPRRALISTGTAVAGNVLMNCFLIPRYKAMGAAWATPLSYAPFLAVLLWQVNHIREPQRGGERA